MAFDDDSSVSNTSSNETLTEIAARRPSRRGFLGGNAATAAVASLGGVTALLQAVPAQAKISRTPLLGFNGVPTSSADEVVVPAGYTARVLIAWGDPVSEGRSSSRMPATPRARANRTVSLRSGQAFRHFRTCGTVSPA